MQTKNIHGTDFVIVREDIFGLHDGIVTITDAVPLDVVKEAIQNGDEHNHVYPVRFISFKSSSSQVVS